MNSLAVMSDAAFRRKAVARPIAALAPVAITLLTLATEIPVARAVLGGRFDDPDDAMRLVEVRSWMAGQSWFDLAAHRLDPPVGASMHWSRLVDLPNALLIRLLAPFTAHPEAWDRIVLPTILLALLYAGVARLAVTLVGPEARWPAYLGMLLCGVTLVLFQPGRIGHHGPETLGLLWSTTLLLESLRERDAFKAAASGALAALTLAMSLETLPYVGVLCAAIVALWILRGSMLAKPLAGFSAGLGGALPALYAAEVPWRDWFAPVCDALGAAHLGAALIFAAGGLLLAAATPKLPQTRGRFCAAAGVALAAGIFVAVSYPACLGSPFRLVDPLVRALWLSRVVESLPLAAFARGRLDVAAALLMPMLFGTAAALWAAWRLRGAGRDLHAVIAALCLAGVVVGCWQVRGFTSVGPFGVCAGLYAVDQIRRKLATVTRAQVARLAGVAIVPFASTGWALMLPSAPAPSHAGPDCLAPGSLAPLARLAPGRLLAPLQAGSHLLEATPHAVFAGPYHRNNDGNRFELDAFMAAPDRAEQLMRGRDVTFLAICSSLHETATIADEQPKSLAAVLLNGDTPPFLRAVPLGDTPFKAWAVIPNR